MDEFKDNEHIALLAVQMLKRITKDVDLTPASRWSVQTMCENGLTHYIEHIVDLIISSQP